jgi:ADP-ribosyl-[dinitrogen reductase] hydrolase
MIDQTFTSANNPLRIAEIPFGSKAGLIGVTFAPGKQQQGESGLHKRDLNADLDRIASWGAVAIVTLVEAHELDELEIQNLGREVQRRRMEWFHWPIKDYGVPDAEFEASWPARSAKLRAVLASGGRVLIHCKGGLGRAGTISARLLVEAGVEPEQAMAIVRAARPKAIENTQQERWIALGRPAPLPADGERLGGTR